MLSEALFLYHAFSLNYLDWYYSFYPQGLQLQKKSLSFRDTREPHNLLEEQHRRLSLTSSITGSIQTSFRKKVRNIYVNSIFNLLVHTIHRVCVQAEGELYLHDFFLVNILLFVI